MSLLLWQKKLTPAEITPPITKILIMNSNLLEVMQRNKSIKPNTSS